VSSAPSLYRRHRPRSFADLVGQEPVVRTLRHAVERGKVHHAYLFVGSRGTGKTSMAKILAACLDCERGPTTEPCGVCESCRSIANATSLDVIEMDAASNNSVDDIRDLRDSVAYAPVSGRHKVYILDEAHMLSSAAWNAFLKTLEEPPPNTIFVLATTEAQKVPATVVDRCHRFDFQRPTVEQIAGVIRRAAAAESIDIPAPAVAALARAATGSFRDALGTLEQLVTYSGPQIALEDVLAVLGVADAELVEEAFEAVGAGDARRALLAVHRCTESGHDASAFASDLEVRARELLVVHTLDEVPDELSLTPEADDALLAQAQRLPHSSVVRVLELLAGALEAVRAGADPRTQLELALVKAATPHVDGSTRALLARLERLEGALAARDAASPESGPRRSGGNGGSVPLAGPPTAPLRARRDGVASPAPAPSAPTSSAPAPSAPASSAPAPSAPASSAPAPCAPASSAPAPSAPASSAPASSEPGAAQPSVSRGVPSPSPESAPVAVSAGAETGLAVAGPAPDGEAAVAEAEPQAAVAEPAAAEAAVEPGAVEAQPEPASPPQWDSVAPAVAGSEPGDELAELSAVWPAVIDATRAQNSLLAALIAEARPVALSGEEVTVAFAMTDAFVKKKAEAAANRAAVAEAMRQVTGRRLRPVYELRELPDGESPVSPPPTGEEWVRRFKAEFDAEELPPEQEGA